jgi:hypothetical protein
MTPQGDTGAVAHDAAKTAEQSANARIKWSMTLSSQELVCQCEIAT